MTNLLQFIQQKLKSPKSEYNEFGKYSYRSKEKILGALKPLLQEVNATLYFFDTLLPAGDHVFVCSKAVLQSSELPDQIYSAFGYALHATELKGMQPAQVTGATSSYAQKAALEALFLLESGSDIDAMKPPVAIRKTTTDRAPLPSGKWLNAGTKEYTQVFTDLKNKTTTLDEVKKTYRISMATEAKLTSEAK